MTTTQPPVNPENHEHGEGSIAEQLAAQLATLDVMVWYDLKVENPEAYAGYERWQNEQIALRDIIGADMKDESWKIWFEERQKSREAELADLVARGVYKSIAEARLKHFTSAIDATDPELPWEVQIVHNKLHDYEELINQRLDHYGVFPETEWLGFGPDFINLKARKSYPHINTTFLIRIVGSELEIQSHTVDVSAYRAAQDALKHGIIDEQEFNRRLDEINEQTNGVGWIERSGDTLEDIYGEQAEQVISGVIAQMKRVQNWFETSRGMGLDPFGDEAWEFIE